MKFAVSVLLRWLLLLPICCLGNQWLFPPDDISTTGVDASDPVIVVDPNGNVVAIWLENDVVMSNSTIVKQPWSSPPSVVSGSGASSPQLVIDTGGNATAIWEEGGVIKSSTMPVGGSWPISPAVLSTSGASSPQIAVDGSGNLVAVWEQGGLIMSSTQLFGGSWNVTPDVISSSGASLPQVAANSEGDVVAVWQGTVGSVSTVFASTKSIAGSWGSAPSISSTGRNSGSPQVAIDPSGNVIAMWFRFDFSGDQYSHVVVQSALQPVGQSWESPVDVSSPGIRNPTDLTMKITYDGNLNPVAVWTSSYDGMLFNVEGAILNSDGWTVLSQVVSENQLAHDVDLTVDNAGNVYLVWMSLDPDTSAPAIRGTMSAFRTFQDFFWAQWTLSADGNSAYPSCMANGSPSRHVGVVAWVNYDGSNTKIQAITTGLTILQPPSSPAVVQQSVDYGVFTELYNVISWDASPSSNLWGYSILRNGLPLAQVSPDVLEFTDLNRDVSETVTYQISAIDNNGFESDTVSVTYP